jgi:hypothetical protein
LLQVSGSTHTRNEPIPAQPQYKNSGTAPGLNIKKPT